MKKLITISVACMLYCLNIAAQIPKTPKFGKITQEELEIITCTIDSSASAVVLFDIGVSKMVYNQSKYEFVLETQRHVRIKVLTKDGMDYADIAIPAYSDGGKRERITNIKAQTYNLEDGKIVTESISKKDIFEEKVTDKKSLKKFTLPKIKEGSVFEYSYSVESDFTYNLESWDFQSKIPTLLSIYEVSIPDYYRYNNRVLGYERVNTSTKQTSETILFSTRVYSGQTSRIKTETVSVKMNVYSYFAENLPGLSREVFVDNIRNYITRVDFELLSVQFPGGKLYNYSNTWESVTKDLLEHSNFGKELTGTRFMREDIKSTSDTITDQLRKTHLVFNHIKNTIKWNGRYRLLTDKGVKTAYKDGSGNSAEVNLCLIAALREAGVVAYPIVLSTRENGMVQTWEVTFSKFNHVIAGVKVGEKMYFFDATSDFSVANILPLPCLNGNGRIIDEKNGGWIDLNPSTISKSTIMGNFTLDNEGNASGLINLTAKDYSALRIHQILLNDDGYKDYRESLQKRYNNGDVDSISVTSSVTPSPEYKVSYIVTVPDSYIDATDLIYLTPGIGLFTNNNPFTAKERKLPINFHFPFEQSIILKYKIPEGYAFQEAPQNKAVRALDGRTSFSYSVSVIGDEIMVVNKVVIGQTLFIPDDYKALREFYDFMATKNNEKIILKKL